MLDMVGRHQEAEVKFGCVALMLDAIVSEFVDMGDQLNEDDIALEALVFIVVGLKGY